MQGSGDKTSLKMSGQTLISLVGTAGPLETRVVPTNECALLTRVNLEWSSSISMQMAISIHWVSPVALLTGTRTLDWLRMSSLGVSSPFGTCSRGCGFFRAMLKRLYVLAISSVGHDRPSWWKTSRRDRVRGNVQVIADIDLLQMVLSRY